MADAPKSIKTYRLTDHAKTEMARRAISEDDIAAVLASPEQSEHVREGREGREGREVYQSRFELGDPPKTFLIRVFVDFDREPAAVVTVYRTSKVEKYWRPE